MLFLSDPALLLAHNHHKYFLLINLGTILCVLYDQSLKSTLLLQNWNGGVEGWNKEQELVKWTAGLTWGKPGVDVRGDGQDNVRKEERIRDETDVENMCYDLIDFGIMEL